MMMQPASIGEFSDLIVGHGLHTVEVAAADTQGHLRGKRVPVPRFTSEVHRSGLFMSDVVFVLDMTDDIPDNEFINVDTGYGDCRLDPDLSTFRILGHRPGYGLVFADVRTQTGSLHPLAPRSVLVGQLERCRQAGLRPLMATETEFYLCHEDWSHVQDYLQYASLTDEPELEAVILAIRQSLATAGIAVDSSNTEYGPGQFEVNIAPADPLTAADNAVLYKSIVKQVARSRGFRATFMAKPWNGYSGSSMHVHMSLGRGDEIGFAPTEVGQPNELMTSWVGGLLANASALSLLGGPTANSSRRRRPYTFSPTTATWAVDNRTALVRCVLRPDPASTRVEYRGAGADANPYLLLAGLLAAGLDGVANGLDPGPVGDGDQYRETGDRPPLPATLGLAIDAFEASPLAADLGDAFARSFTSLARVEWALAAKHNPSLDEVNDWERCRYLARS